MRPSTCSDIVQSGPPPDHGSSPSADGVSITPFTKLLSYLPSPRHKMIEAGAPQRSSYERPRRNSLACGNDITKGQAGQLSRPLIRMRAVITIVLARLRHEYESVQARFQLGGARWDGE